MQEISKNIERGAELGGARRWADEAEHALLVGLNLAGVRDETIAGDEGSGVVLAESLGVAKAKNAVINGPHNAGRVVVVRLMNDHN
jgi:hypothetical protein